ncbi:MAG: hypothetical protein LBK54_11750 [Propionibacteriaceae bacterium]|jgi:hypothetical protein|nr:hypothetical protein [Propionibacteriaceae bacterium]
MSRYRWLAEPAPADAELASDLSLGFDRSAEAEDWLGAVHTDLLQAGVERVSLCQDDVVIWGPMELAPASDEAAAAALDKEG